MRRLTFKNSVKTLKNIMQYILYKTFELKKNYIFICFCRKKENNFTTKILETITCIIFICVQYQ